MFANGLHLYIVQHKQAAVWPSSRWVLLSSRRNNVEVSSINLTVLSYLPLNREYQWLNNFPIMLNLYYKILILA